MAPKIYVDSRFKAVVAGFYRSNGFSPAFSRSGNSVGVSPVNFLNTVLKVVLMRIEAPNSAGRNAKDRDFLTGCYVQPAVY
jgi:hypothetical protein